MYKKDRKICTQVSLMSKAKKCTRIRMDGQLNLASKSKNEQKLSSMLKAIKTYNELHKLGSKRGKTRAHCGCTQQKAWKLQDQ